MSGKPLFVWCYHGDHFTAQRLHLEPNAATCTAWNLTMRLAWLTDIHLNFASIPARRALMESLDEACDALVITGDIGESRSVAGFLRELELMLRRPIYFVLGNHDFYHSSIAETREAVSRQAADSEHQVYLTAEGVIGLTPQTALIGHDGWADGRLGDFDGSDVILNDYALIDELRFWTDAGEFEKHKVRDILLQLGDNAAAQLEAKLVAATSDYRHIIAATHVPPFRESVWYDGRLSDDNWLPHFSCRAAGDAMRCVMQSKPECDLLVLCGHTHGGGESQPLENLRVLTGSAKYGAPAIQRVVEVA
jgi:Icc-related predicted phosphoesterase